MVDGFFYSAGAEFIYRGRLVNSAVVFIGSGLTKVYSPKAEPISGRRFFYSTDAEFVFVVLKHLLVHDPALVIGELEFVDHAVAHKLKPHPHYFAHFVIVVEGKKEDWCRSES